MSKQEENVVNVSTELKNVYDLQNKQAKNIKNIISKKIKEIEHKIEHKISDNKSSEHEVIEIEPMLVEDINRFTLFPIKYDDLWKLYKKHERAIWHAEEIDYGADKEDWNKLTADEKFFIENILAFFAGADGIVLENLMSNFSKEVQWAEARSFYSIQGFMEQVHSETYSLLIDSFVSDPVRKDQMFRSIETIPSIKKKAEWAIKWMDPKNASFAERLVAFCVVEGVFFSGSFCSIFWLKSRGIMTKALGASNDFIARDENLHCLYGITLYNKLVNKLSKERIHEIFKEAMEIESEFITESIPCKMIGMNSVLMTKYVKFVSSYWMSQLMTDKGKLCPKLYKVDNPFSFMDMIGFDGKANFFETRPTQYAKSKINKEAYSEPSDDF
jgi:ribonucleoside-diphosphate reductase beta chain